MWSIRSRARLAVDRARWLFGVPLSCDSRGSGGRVSPDGQLTFTVGGLDALVCYGRPTARGRKVFGGLVPFGQLWRTGANEPTVIHLPFPAEIAGIKTPRGKYALYTIPDPSQWRLVINRSTRQWGLTRDELGSDGRLYPNSYGPWVQSKELARAAVTTQPIAHVEQFTLRAEVHDATTTHLLLEWETTQVRVPIRAR